MKQRRVVVTGLGAVTSLGLDVDTIWSNILAGKSGVSTIERVDVSDMTSQIAAEIKDFDIEQYMSRLNFAETIDFSPEKLFGGREPVGVNTQGGASGNVAGSLGGGAGSSCY